MILIVSKSCLCFKIVVIFTKKNEKLEMRRNRKTKCILLRSLKQNYFNYLFKLIVHLL